jgi:hypothetical protein
MGRRSATAATPEEVELAIRIRQEKRRQAKLCRRQGVRFAKEAAIQQAEANRKQEAKKAKSRHSSKASYDQKQGSTTTAKTANATPTKHHCCKTTPIQCTPRSSAATLTHPAGVMPSPTVAATAAAVLSTTPKTLSPPKVTTVHDDNDDDDDDDADGLRFDGRGEGLAEEEAPDYHTESMANLLLNILKKCLAPPHNIDADPNMKRACLRLADAFFGLKSQGWYHCPRCKERSDKTMQFVRSVTSRNLPMLAFPSSLLITKG